MEKGVDFEFLKSRWAGCYVTVPTPFEDSAGFPVNHHAIRSYVRFLLDHGLNTDYATLLSGGAAGDFSTMGFEERISVAETIADEAKGKIPLAFGGQTTSTLELVRLGEEGQARGLRLIQV